MLIPKTPEQGSPTCGSIPWLVAESQSTCLQPGHVLEEGRCSQVPQLKPEASEFKFDQVEYGQRFSGCGSDALDVHLRDACFEIDALGSPRRTASSAIWGRAVGFRYRTVSLRCVDSRCV